MKILKDCFLGRELKLVPLAVTNELFNFLQSRGGDNGPIFELIVLFLGFRWHLMEDSCIIFQVVT